MKRFLTFVLLACAAAAFAAGKKSVYSGVFPPDIKCIAVLSPASCPNKKQIMRGIAMLEAAGVKVKLMPHSFVPKRASLEQRLEAWNMAVNDPEVDMIIPTRGGSGAQDLLNHIDWNKVRERKIILMGFSNITYLTSAMMFHKAGYPIAGPNVGRLVSATPATRAHLKNVLAKQSPAPVKLIPLRAGDAGGKPYAGHIAMLEGNVKSPLKFIPDGRIVFIECVRRDTAVIAKSFDCLFNAGFFNNVKAVVLCHFSRVKDKENLDKVFADLTSKLKCPVYKGYPYGHENANFPIDFQANATIKDDTLTFSY